MSEMMAEIDPVRDLGLKGEVSPEEAGDAKSETLVTDWMKEIHAAEKREKQYRKDARALVSLYEAAKKKDYQYNILYANTETMQPALYNSTPRPVVQRRFKDEDPIGLAAARICERTLSYLVDDGNAEYESFDNLMKQATLEGLVPGRGVTWFKYDAKFGKPPEDTPADEANDSDSDEELPEAGVAQQETVEYETVCGEEVSWDRFLHGFARKWRDVPWVGREHLMTREELEENFPDVGKQVPVSTPLHNDGDDETAQMRDRDEESNIKVAQVYEIWCKTTKEVLFLCPTWPRAPLKVVPDPLKLAGFFPCPRPLAFVSKISDLLPVPLYAFYEEQARELNTITVRINKITAALKVRGMYDSTVEAINKVLEADDNTLVAAENVAALLASGNALEKSIWLMPIEKLVTVLQQLYVQREQIKTVIHELTGLADIMRGSSQASETLGAQQLKNQWGTLRLKRVQKEVMRYARDCLRIMAEIAVSKLSVPTLKAMTGLQFPTQQEKMQAKQVLAQLGQQPQIPGQPPQTPPPELLAAANSPSWEELVAVLQNDTQRNYRIDIETNSTVDAEATEDKQDISELLNAMSQFLNGIGPMVKDGTVPFDVAQGILLAVVRRYRFGPELEDQLKKMQAPQENGDPEKIKKQEEELAKKTEEFEKLVQTETAKFKEQQQDLKMQQKELEMEKRFAQKELEMQKQYAQKDIELEVMKKEQSLALKEQGAEQKIALKTSMVAQQHKQANADLAGKSKEVAAREAKVDPTAIAAPLIQALADGFADMGRQLSEGLVQAAKVPKRAVKQKDGSWSSEVAA